MKPLAWGEVIGPAIPDGKLRPRAWSASQDNAQVGPVREKYRESAGRGRRFRIVRKVQRLIQSSRSTLGRISILHQKVDRDFFRVSARVNGTTA